MTTASAEPPDTAREVTADRPRTRLEEDELGYRDFAEAIAAGLASRAGDDGLVIAVHGKWGSGKTSAVNMVVDALARREQAKDESARTIVVRFNPWWFSEQKDLTRAFFGEVNASIGEKLSVGASGSSASSPQCWAACGTRSWPRCRCAMTAVSTASIAVGRTMR